MTALSTLIERLEALTTPCRVVDGLIADAIWLAKWGKKRPKDIIAEDVTASIDAAMTLAGDNWKPVLDVAMFWQWEKYHDASKLADLPRFICLSALRMREAT